MSVTPATFVPGPAALYAQMGRALNLGDIVHVQHSYAFFQGMRPWNSRWQTLLGQMDRGVVLTIHELDDRATGAYHLPAAWELAYKRWFNARAFLHPAISEWIVHSSLIEQALLELGAPAERVHYWRHPVSAEPPPLPDAEAARRRFGLEEKRVLTIIGFLARRKGYDLAIEALAKLPDDVVLLCAGGEHAADRTRPTEWVKELAKAAGVSERVRVTGFLSEKDFLQALAATNLVLAPFREVSGSGSLALAIAHRLPILAAGLPPLADIDCLERFPVGDADALALSAKLLLEHPQHLEKLNRMTQEYAAENTYEALAARTVELYTRLLSQPEGDR